MPITFGIEARHRLLRGATKLAKLVGCTYGPGGKTVLIERFGGLLPTKDGYTVAHEADFTDPLESMGAKLLRESCLTVNERVGDGTTTTAIIAAKLATEGHKLVISGADLKEFGRGLQSACGMTVEAITNFTITTEDPEIIRAVSQIASNYDDDLATPLLQACLEVGKYGTVVIQDGKSVEVTYQLKEGMELDAGYSSPYYVNDMERMCCDLDGPLVALIDGGLTSVHEMRPILEEASGFGGRPVLIIAHYIEAEAQGTMVINGRHGNIESCAVKVPGVGNERKKSILEDLASMSGATVVSADLGMDVKKFKSEWLGAFRNAQVFAKKTLLTSYEDHEEAIYNRVQFLNRQIEMTEDEFDRDLIRNRMAKLAGGFAVVEVGGYTESELKERRSRIEDSLGAIRAALQNGVCLGGGSTLFQISYLLEDTLTGCQDLYWFEMGVQAMVKALREPMLRIMENAGYSGGGVLVDRIAREEDACLGFDVRLGKPRDFQQPPWIVDPSDLLIVAVESAVSVALMLLSVEVVVTSKR